VGSGVVAGAAIARILWWTPNPFRWSLEGFNGSVELGPFRNRESKNVICRHQRKRTWSTTQIDCGAPGGKLGGVTLAPAANGGALVAAGDA